MDQYLVFGATKCKVSSSIAKNTLSLQCDFTWHRIAQFLRYDFLGLNVNHYKFIIFLTDIQIYLCFVRVVKSCKLICSFSIFVCYETLLYLPYDKRCGIRTASTYVNMKVMRLPVSCLQKFRLFHDWSHFDATFTKELTAVFRNTDYKIL